MSCRTLPRCEVILCCLCHGNPAWLSDRWSVATKGGLLCIGIGQDSCPVRRREIVCDPESTAHISAAPELSEHPDSGAGPWLDVPEAQAALQLRPVRRAPRPELPAGCNSGDPWLSPGRHGLLRSTLGVGGSLHRFTSNHETP
jgi:hypothetical protein